MNRRHTADDYLKIIDRLRELVPHIALSGDFIVGFPGETDRDFADTIKLVDTVKYASAYSFKYSARPGTPASSNDAQIDEQVKSERLSALQQLLDAQQLAFNRNCADTKMVVLMEKQAGRDGQLSGRSPFMQSVYVDAPIDEIGKMKQVIITDTRQNSLSGEFV